MSPYGRVRTHFQSNKFYDRVSVACSQESELCDSHSVEAICPVTLSESKKKHGSKKFNLDPEDFTFKEKIGGTVIDKFYDKQLNVRRTVWRNIQSKVKIP